MQRIIVGIAVWLVVVAFAGAPARAQFQFNECGTLVEGVECVLFESERGGLYVIGGDLGGFGLGSEFRVTGIVDPGCITFCQQGNGCIFNATISPCEEPCPCDVVSGDGVNILDLLAYLVLLFEGSPEAECDGAPGEPVLDLLCFLECWFEASDGVACP